MRELARPPINAVRTRAGSAPALEANSVMFLPIRLDRRKRPRRPTDHNREARGLSADLSARHEGVKVVAFRPGAGGGDYR